MANEPAHFLSQIEDEPTRARVAARLREVSLLAERRRDQHQSARSELAEHVARYRDLAFGLLENVIVEADDIAKATVDATPEAISVPVRMAHHGLMARGLQTAWEILAMLRAATAPTRGGEHSLNCPP
jgi:hypothetical protein